jgi:hypothetical protein
VADEPASEEPAPFVAAEPVVAEEPAPFAAEEPPVVAAEEGFAPVEPSPFVADPASEEQPLVAPEEEAWFVADVQEPAPAPERAPQSDTWSGRPIGS